MKRYRIYSDPLGSDQQRIKAKNYHQAVKKGKKLVDKPERIKVYCQTIVK